MQTEKISSTAIVEAALKVSSREELTQMSEPQRMSLMHLIAKRLDRQPPPTQAELQGIKELVVDHLSHPALAALSPQPKTPTTTNQPVLGNGQMVYRVGL